MKVYCGTDIIEVQRIKDAVINTSKFKEAVFTKEEIEDIDHIQSDVKYQRFAGRFAAKEAIYKALSKILIENNINMDFLDVEILNIKALKNRPVVNILSEDIRNIFDNLDAQIDISISHVKDMAVANAILTVGKE